MTQGKQVARASTVGRSRGPGMLAFAAEQAGPLPSVPSGEALSKAMTRPAREDGADK